MVLVDTNVLSDLATNDPTWAGWSEATLRQAALNDGLSINAVVYAELSVTFPTIEGLEAFLGQLEIVLADMPRAALFLAGKAFRNYRRAGGPRQSVLPDFFIGAHAAVAGLDLLTRDVRRYRAWFPTVRLVAPGR